MSVSTTQLKDFEKYVDNIYEAIIIIAKRAKQINEEQKRMIESELPTEDDSDIYGDEQELEIIKDYETKFPKLPKPTLLALNEMLSGKLNFEYLNRHDV